LEKKYTIVPKFSQTSLPPPGAGADRRDPTAALPYRQDHRRWWVSSVSLPSLSSRHPSHLDLTNLRLVINAWMARVCLINRLLCCALPLHTLFSRNKSATSNQPTVLFSQNKSATSNQPTVLFSQNKSATSHRPNEQADSAAAAVHT
jgi:hypothetical protein